MGPIRLGSEKVWVRVVLGPKRFRSESSQKFWVRVVLGPSCLTVSYKLALWAAKKGHYGILYPAHVIVNFVTSLTLLFILKKIPAQQKWLLIQFVY